MKLNLKILEAVPQTVDKAAQSVYTDTGTVSIAYIYGFITGTSFSKRFDQIEMKNPTIRDVAEQAGVGLATVSRVINNSPQVSSTTRLKVLEAIDALNFVPNPSARRLSWGKTLTISVIAPFFTRPSITERLRGIEITLVDSEYDMILYNVETVKRRDECIHEVIRSERTDGVIIISLSPQEDDLPLLINADVPIVLVDANHPSLSQFNRVIVDDIEGGKKATQHLLDIGHQKIAFLGDKFDNPFYFTSSRYRFEGYCHALTESGLEIRPDYVFESEHGRYQAYEIACKMLSSDQPPTSVFAASDTQAMGVIQAARDLNLNVPGDLSVIGYDDLEIAEYLGLSTIRQLLFESGQRGIELLLEAIQEKPNPPICEILPTELIIRDTTASPR